MFARPGLCGMGIGRLGLVAASQPNLVAQALAILAKYGSAANLYLPGVGAINGITAGNWLDSAGTTAATVDGQVGLVVSAGKAVGPELVTNGDFSAGSAGWSVPAGWSIASGVCTATTTPASFRQIANSCIAGKFYLVEFDWTHAGGTLYVRVGVGAAATFTTSGRKSVVLVAAGTQGFEAYGGAVSGVLDNISVRELPGAHLSQSTAANRPVLRQSGGVYSWQFDGSSDGFASTMTTGNEGWFCAGVAYDSGRDAYSALLYAGEVDVTKKSVYLFKGTNGFNARKVALAISDGTNRYILNSPYQVAVGVPVVVDCGWSSVQRFISVNGSVTSESSANTYGPSAGAAQIGTYCGTNNFNGRLFPIFFAPTVLPTAAERATLRQFIASLSGVTM